MSRMGKHSLSGTTKGMLYSTAVLSMFVLFGQGKGVAAATDTGIQEPVTQATADTTTVSTGTTSSDEEGAADETTTAPNPEPATNVAETATSDQTSVAASTVTLDTEATQAQSTGDGATDASAPIQATAAKAAAPVAPADDTTAPAVAAAITSVVKQDSYYEVTYANGQVARLSVLEGNIVRYYIDPTGEYGDPAQSGEGLNARILTKEADQYPLDIFKASTLTDNGTEAVIDTGTVQIHINKQLGTMSVTKGDKTLMQETKPIEVKQDKTTEYLARGESDHYFGGGTQNGDFALLGERVRIEKGGWTSGGSASPNPFYWSTSGYGVLRNTFMTGLYDFDFENTGEITTTQNENRFDAFYVFADTAQGLIKGYYELTGNPLMMPEYGFYQAHLNAFNRDVWIKVPEGTSGAYKFPDGNYYKEYNPEDMPADLKGQGIKESLNGEGTADGQDNYQFSAREMIDLYEKYDMPLGWFLPNDGYKAGYGQTDTLAGNIENLKAFIEYANEHNIQVGLWTQQNLEPEDPDNPKPDDRDFAAEVAAGVVALKTDVAWVGDGYSFGLDGIQKALDKMEAVVGDTVRPFVITLDGWAGTQRMAGIWDGDQYGGEWEYIRFHIPTYIGEGLSGQPNVGSDTDGIYGGNNPIINAREFEWKTFTPIELNMDGWGSQQKLPWVYGEKNTAINRAYLKLKSMLMPYMYTSAMQAITEGNPMVRAMFLAYPELPEAYTDLVQYEYMWGDNFLVAPIYQDTAADEEGNDIRNGIYLPDSNQIWIDYYTGKEYQGGQVLNNFDAPLWKLPVFIKAGAIIPTAPATNNATEYDQAKSQRQYQIYASGDSQYTTYEDDGLSAKYLAGASATTKITSSLKGQELTLTVDPTEGTYEGMPTSRTTQFDVRTKTAPAQVTATIGGQTVTLTEVKSQADFDAGVNVWFDNTNYLTNSYLEELGTGLAQHFLMIKLDATDVTQNQIVVKVSGVDTTAAPENTVAEPTAAIAKPNLPTADAATITTTSIPTQWDAVAGATGYNVKIDGLLYTGIKDPNFTIENVTRGTQHTIQVQTVTADGVSEWSDEATFETNDDPLELTPTEFSAKYADGTDVLWQDDTDLKYLFDGNTTTLAHSAWDVADATPMSIYASLDGDYDLDKIVYIPRDGGGNGNLNALDVYVSDDGVTWQKVASASGWAVNADPKTIDLPDGTHGAMLRFDVPDGAGRGGFVSGNEIQIVKIAGVKKRVPGDINNDGQINAADVQTLKQYAGLNSDDAAFAENARPGDVNGSGVVDAYDANFIMGQLGTTPAGADSSLPSGSITLATDKTTYNPGDTVTVSVIGRNLANVNAISLSLPVNTKVATITGITAGDMTSGMENLSRVVTHDDGTVEAFFMFANEGEKARLTGDGILGTITLKMAEAPTVNPIELNLSTANAVNQKSPNIALANSSAVLELAGTVDVSGLEQSIKLAEALAPADYTPASFSALTAAITAGKAALASPTAASVAKAQTQMLDAFGGLVPMQTVDTSVVTGLLDAAKTLPAENYTAESFAALQEAITFGDSVVNGTPTRADVANAMALLANGLAGLQENTPDGAKTALTDLIAAADQVNPDSYNPETATALADALAAAKTVLADPTTDDTQLLAANTKLAAALAGLTPAEVIPPVQTTALAQAIKQAEKVDADAYLPSTSTKLTNALTAGATVLAGKPTQAQVDEAVLAIVTALTELKVKPSEADRAAVSDLINQINQLDASQYTAESYAPALDAATQAQQILDDPETTTADLAATAAQLSVAVEGLTKLQPKTPIDDKKADKTNSGHQQTKDSGKPVVKKGQSDSTAKAVKPVKVTKAAKSDAKAAKKLPKTGETNATVLGLGGLMMSLLTLIGIGNRLQKRD